MTKTNSCTLNCAGVDNALQLTIGNIVLSERARHRSLQAVTKVVFACSVFGRSCKYRRPEIQLAYMPKANSVDYFPHRDATDP